MPRKAKGAKPAKAKKAAAPKPVDQEVKGKKAAEVQPDTGPLSGVGHNLTAVKKLIVPFADRYNRILDEKASNAASFMADCRVLIEDAANELGCKKRLVRAALTAQRAKLKQDEKEAEMDQAELDQLDTMRDALGLYGDTPLGQAAIKKAEAATPAKGAKAKVTMTEKKPRPKAAKPKTNGATNVVPMPDPKAEDVAHEEGQAAA